MGENVECMKGSMNYVWADLLVEELVRNGVTCFCIAPGSRSSALTVSATRHEKTETVIHFDERGLAFYALGRVSVTKQPVALICSSGTAAANFFPAVIEASKKKVPLILLTADRPPELRNTGAMQTIDQVKLYGNYVRWFTDLPTPDVSIPPEALLTTVDQAVHLAKHPMGGPVHINCMFREPLEPHEAECIDNEYFDNIRSWYNGQKVYTRWTTGKTHSNLTEDKELLSIIDKTKRGIIVVGKLSSKEEEKAVVQLAKKLNWPLFPDIVSGLRMGSYFTEQIIHYFDQVLLSKAFSDAFPIDTVLHLGGRITSKRWYGYINRQKPKHYITVLSHSLRNDPQHMVTLRIKSTVMDVVRSLIHSAKATNMVDHLEFLKGATQTVASFINDFTVNWDELNEIGVARTISLCLPEDHGLFLSNSMPVREMDMYAVPGKKGLLIGANRGASGIDGIVATACGFTAANGATSTLLTGDLALLHDLNSLALTRYSKNPLIIVAINNDGGGIFSFLPIAQSEDTKDIFESCFATPHGLKFSHAAAMMGLDYYCPQSLPDFRSAYEDALQKKKSCIIEVFTNRKENFDLHGNLQKNIAKSLDKMLQ